MSYPEKKTKKMEEPSPTLQSNPTPSSSLQSNPTPSSSLQSNPTPSSSLPYDLLLSCIARVSRLYYPTLSLVSKSFRSLLASPELYRARSVLGRTEKCLYVCVQPSDMNANPTWFTLCRKPIQTLTHRNHKSKSTSKSKSKSKSKEKSSGYVLAKVPILDSPRVGFLSLVSVGSNIYNIGPGSSYYLVPSSSVWVLGCRYHTWHEAPSMKVELVSLSATVVDQKIYVAGNHRFLKDSLEVFDTRTQIWDHLPCSEAKTSFVGSRSACIDGKLHLRSEEEVFCYSFDKGRWYQLAESSVCRSVFSDSCCEIENVLYSVDWEGELLWYDTEESAWSNLEGLVGLPKLSQNSVRLADYGGKMVVLWFEHLPSSDQRMIWCAEIALERRGNREIWGEVEWLDHILTVPMGFGLLKVLVATV